MGKVLSGTPAYTEVEEGEMSESDSAFEPAVVESEPALAETVRMPLARDADHVMTVLDETECVLLKLESSWWGNEAFGKWGEWWFAHPDGVSPSGKALFVTEAILPRDPLGKLNFAERVLNERGGYTSKAARRERRKAFHWDDDRAKPGPGTLPTDERDRVTDVSVPLSVIDVAVRAPESHDNVVVEDGAIREGPMSAGDVRLTGTTHTKYGSKATLAGDTYDALSSGGANVSAAVWEEAHPAYDGDGWTADTDPEALWALAEALNDAGFSFAVPEKFGDALKEAADEAETADVVTAFNV